MVSFFFYITFKTYTDTQQHRVTLKREKNDGVFSERKKAEPCIHIGQSQQSKREQDLKRAIFEFLSGSGAVHYILAVASTIKASQGTLPHSFLPVSMQAKESNHMPRLVPTRADALITPPRLRCLTHPGVGGRRQLAASRTPLYISSGT